jgi:thermostable 8-oxoguanine DNA glycosylase
MNTNVKSPAKAPKTTTKVIKAEVVSKDVVKAVESKKTIEMAIKINGFDNKNASSYDRLMDTKRRAILDSMSLSKLAENFIKSGVNLTDKQREVLTFKNIITFVKGSKYCDLKLFTPQQMVYICSGVIKLHDANTARAERAAKQNQKEAAK